MAEFYGYTWFERNEVILAAPAVSNFSCYVKNVTPVQHNVKVRIYRCAFKEAPCGVYGSLENGTTIDRSCRCQP
jgi:hypothetical protein